MKGKLKKKNKKFYVLLRHLLYVANRKKDWILFQYSYSMYSLIYENGSSLHCNTMTHRLIFKQKNPKKQKTIIFISDVK